MSNVIENHPGWNGSRTRMLRILSERMSLHQVQTGKQSALAGRQNMKINIPANKKWNEFGNNEAQETDIPRRDERIENQGHSLTNVLKTRKGTLGSSQKPPDTQRDNIPKIRSPPTRAHSPEINPPTEKRRQKKQNTASLAARNSLLLQIELNAMKRLDIWI
ncbi:hypothetical protein LIPSTDRAFT_62096 [Lipomyces starkeyi NRRL Y-11557]|uniref:Uncharacterized protein n=1 Tax=Lipomyces starkeyi NRRL Y-11557 TaxID=675824 RepID=A0A1E3QE69_LIPST|nr:hypothetical protein LIPSTDRAFT_62096 [Lipomyces starkeyi NRRL Y-11557]